MKHDDWNLGEWKKIERRTKRGSERTAERKE